MDYFVELYLPLVKKNEVMFTCNSELLYEGSTEWETRLLYSFFFNS